jgi:survival-of-motor-neuron-related-splicing factor 30
MERADLESYQYQVRDLHRLGSLLKRTQLAQVKQAYAADPTNAELITLKDELESLIKLTLEYLAAAEPASATSLDAPKPRPAVASTSKPAEKRKQPLAAAPPSSATLKPGEECLARYSGDSKMYPARIVSIGGSSENTVFSVIFKGYDTTELVSAGDVKPLTVDKKRALELQAEDEDKEKRRKKNAKKAETRQVKNQEQVGKQQAWQSFAKKSTKKGGSSPFQRLQSLIPLVSPYPWCLWRKPLQDSGQPIRERCGSNKAISWPELTFWRQWAWLAAGEGCRRMSEQNGTSSTRKASRHSNELAVLERLLYYIAGRRTCMLRLPVPMRDAIVGRPAEQRGLRCST